MKKLLLRVLVLSGVGLTTVVAGLVAFVLLRWDRTFEAPVPALHATQDSAMIVRGRYLAFGPAHCAACHGPAEQVGAVSLVGTPPLSGGYVYPLPFGTLHFPNLTPDEETGIGRYTDGQLARVLRYGVRPDGKMLAPLMEYQNLSDEDIVAILSFLRAQSPVRRVVPPTELNLLGKALATFALRPVEPRGSPPEEPPTGPPSIELGAYLVNSVAQCGACHTRRGADMSEAAPPLSGGTELNEPFAPDLTFVTPNLTPDLLTGRIATWSEEQFLERFRAGRLIPESPMPWEFFGRMSDVDLRAVYRYLMSLEPVRNDTGASVRPRKSG